MNLPQTTIDTLAKTGRWLAASVAILQPIETASQPTDDQVGEVGAEWAGTLSRLDRLH